MRLKVKRNEVVDARMDGSAPHIVQRGAPLGNRNAVGHGAPKGNKNAACPHRADGYRHNRNAVTTGEYETLWKDAMSKEDQAMLRAIDTDPMRQLDEDICLLSYREQRMLGYLKKLQGQRESTEQKNIYKVQKVPTIVEFFDEVTATIHKQKIMRVQKVLVEQIVQPKIVMDQILRIEEALTRVQAKKIRAVEMKNKLNCIRNNSQ